MPDSPRRRLGPELRRGTILDAAEPAFVTQPAAEVIVAEVAAAAGVSEALVFKYFGTKSGLQAAVLHRLGAALATERAAADAALPEGTSARDRVARAIRGWLEAMASDRGISLAAAPGDAVEVAAARAQVRADWLDWLHGVLRLDASARDAFALVGFLGFLDAAGESWRADGCPGTAQWPLTEAALDALQGALGDWRS
ncbi:MAG: TetR/AcrR family transcriptional regulator [Propioniciclava sp.]